uniref:Site-specific integrase n=1 Tax=Streptomyces sp. NBC_00003 TaxID=2903608 RepID=A0AAU2V6S5_9ACTN
MFDGTIYKRCACTEPVLDEQGQPAATRAGRPKVRDLGADCPKLDKRDHGTWFYYLNLGFKPDGTRNRPRKGGFATQTKAKEAAQKIWDLAQAGVDVTSDETCGEYLTRWLENKPSLKRSTDHSYDDYVQRLFIPSFGALKLRDLTARPIEDMFKAIRAENIIREQNQLDAERAREAERHAHQVWRNATAPRDPQLRITWNEAKATAKEALAKPRRPTGPGTQVRIKAALSSALETARKQHLIKENWAALVELPRYKKPKPLLWTKGRVEAWRKTGKKPSPVMVWTTAQTGAFLDSVIYDRLYPLWHLTAFMGLRRGESCALSWSEVDLDEGVIHITEQIVAVSYEPYEDTPKADSIRDIALDQDTLDLLRWWKKVQDTEREDLLAQGKKWIDSGRVFTKEDGSEYHPQFFSDRFERLYKKISLPPVRLHDLRHGSATIALRAGVHIKVVQQRLGHSSIKVTGDTYTAVSEDVEREAAETTLAAVPRARRKILPGAGSDILDRYLKTMMHVPERESDGPLPYEVRQALSIPSDIITDEGAQLFIHGGSYAGWWSVGIQLEAHGKVFGEIRTERDPKPDAAVDAAQRWVQEYCTANSLTLHDFENLNRFLPSQVAPYEVLARCTISSAPSLEQEECMPETATIDPVSPAA